jgi:hypothetical protein
MFRCAMNRGRSVAVAAFVSVVQITPAYADPTPDRERAQLLFDEALRLVDAGDKVAGCAKFRESLAVEASVGTLLNVAECDANEAKPVEAARAYRKALKLNGATSNEARRRAVDEQVAEALRGLEPKIGKLRVTVEPKAANAVITLVGGAGEPVAVSEAVEVAAGEQRVSVEAPGFKTSVDTATVPGGGEVEIRIVLEAVAQKDKNTGSKAAPGPALLVPGVVLGAVGVAGLISGGVLLGLASAKSSDIEALCGPQVAPPACPAGDADAANLMASDGQSFATGSYIAFGVGGALAAAGLVLIVVDATSASTDERRLPPKGQAKLVPTLGGLSLRGTF